MEALAQENDAAISAIKAYEIRFVLNTEKILSLDASQHPLEWRSIKFGTNERDRVPDDKRGVYAFVISDPQAFLPPHGYIMYIGIAGKNSNRSLRERYGDYLTNSKVKLRPHIRNMIVQWHPILRFHFAPVAEDYSTDQLTALEDRLITAFLPPCCKNDFAADTRRQVAAFS
ncbi:MAG: hypothetical protein OXF56_05815 [Rhodobacteraceae bacterium]|nr:hypothetical protein [Paracoccaceae bacterium]